jgi:hypothetical protein
LLPYISANWYHPAATVVQFDPNRPACIRIVRIDELSEVNRRVGLVAPHSASTSPLLQASRSLNFWILPDPVSGKASTTNQCFGVLCGASAARM